MQRDLPLEELIRGLALRNAVEHDGQAKLSSVLGAVFAAREELRSNPGPVARMAGAILKEVNSISLEEQRARLATLTVPLGQDKARSGLPDLQGAVRGQVVMRLAPYPSGQLHLGRARMAILNDEYVKRYDGKLILVIDDTAGSAEKIPIAEAYEGIPRDLEWLGVGVDQTIYKSDRLEIFYPYARTFLQKGWAYVCTCKAEELRRNRAEGRECACRSRSTDENVSEWGRMLSGEYDEGQAVVRLKTDMTDPDLAFRDRVLLRISERSHPRVGRRYRVWPMLEFSWAIDDHLLGITHVLRGKDLMMEDKMERFMWDLLGWPQPVIVHHGMLRIADAKISSSECRRRIEAGEYEGWDDPRTWTLGSLRIRGILPEAIRSFVVSCGLSQTDVQVPVENLYAENRKLIDPLANRYNLVRDPTGIRVLDAPPVRQAVLGLHPDFEERGVRVVPVDPNCIYIDGADMKRFRGLTVRLKDLYNVVLEPEARYAGSGLEQSMPKIQWVSVPNAPVQVVMPDGTRVDALADPGVAELGPKTTVQFIRFGFCRLDDGSATVPVFRYAHG